MKILVKNLFTIDIDKDALKNTVEKDFVTKEITSQQLILIQKFGNKTWCRRHQFEI